MCVSIHIEVSVCVTGWYMYVYICVYLHTGMNALDFVVACIDDHCHIYVCVNTHIYIYTHVYVCVRENVFICLRVCTNDMYTYSCVYVNIQNQRI